MRRFFSTTALSFALFATAPTGNGEEIATVLIEPDSFPRGIELGRFGGVSEAFPLANDAQYYGDSERPFHYCILTKPFHIATKEVTVGQWKEFTRATGYLTEAEKSGEGIVGWSPSEYGEAEKAPDWSAPRHDFVAAPEFTWKNPGFPQEDDHPVVGISWNDAQAFCKWLSARSGKTYRLPTEAEWEMAARQNRGVYHFPWGDEYRSTIHKHANIGNVELEKERVLSAQRHWLLDLEAEPEDGHVFTAPVGSYQASPRGIYDLSGNVFEWCQDYFNHDFYQQWAPKNGPPAIAVDPINLSKKQSRDNELRVIRGGSWYTGPLAARSSARGFFDAPEAAAYLGFRVVREASPDRIAAAPNLEKQLRIDLLSLETAGAKFSTLNQHYYLSFRGFTATESIVEVASRIPGVRRFQNIELDPWTQKAWTAVGAIEDLELIDMQGDWSQTVDLSSLGNQGRLHTLSFGTSSLTPANLKQLAPLTSLEVFSIGRSHDLLQDSDLEILAANRKLRRISLENSTLTGTFLNAFTDHPWLQSLNIRGAHSRDPNLTGWTPAGSKLVASNLTQLRELRLSSCSYTDDCLLPLTKLKRLHSLDISECPNITDTAIAALLSELTVVSDVYLQGTRAGKLVAQVTPQMHFLQKLSIVGSNLDDESLRSIARSKTLRELRLAEGRDEEVARLSETGIALLASVPNLERLVIEVTFPSSDLMEKFTQFPSLQELTLPIELITPSSMDAFRRMPSLKRLTIRTQDASLFNELKSKIEAVNSDFEVKRR